MLYTVSGVPNKAVNKKKKKKRFKNFLIVMINDGSRIEWSPIRSADY